MSIKVQGLCEDLSPTSIIQKKASHNNMILLTWKTLHAATSFNSDAIFIFIAQLFIDKLESYLFELSHNHER